MTNELLGKYGILGNVTLRSFNIKNEHGEIRPANKVTLKMAKALELLMLNIELDNGACTVDLEVPSYDRIYLIMSRLGYQWYNSEWKRYATNLKNIKVTK